MGSTASFIIGESTIVLFPDPNKITHKWKHTSYIDILEDKSLDNVTVGQCCFKSSHNSVVGDVQIFGPASINILARVLNAGVRAIELDIFTSHSSHVTPVVSHGNEENNLQVTSPVNLSTCLQYIRDYAWIDTNEPLFIFFEMNTSTTATLQTMNKLICDYFPDRLYSSKKSLFNVPLRDLANKVIILPSVHKAELKTVAFTSLYGGQFVNRSSADTALYTSDKLTRVYAANTFLSTNPDPAPYITMKNQFVCMNWSNTDKHLVTYKTYFGDKGIYSFL